MQVIRNNILQCLYKFSDDDAKLVQELEEIIKEHGNAAFPVIFHVLTHLDLPQQEAETAWPAICAHREKMSALLEHNVNLRTAICDYFCSIHKSLKNPKVVEIHVFESTLNSAKFDRMTGLYNRAYFDESIIREVARAKRYDTDLSILFLDLDDFKTVNDNFGHPAGDYALKQISQALIQTIRSEDIASRYGGEEIVIILPETSKTTALILAERIRSLIESIQLQFDDKKIPITVSGGVASLPIDAMQAKDLVSFADQALLQAKAAGKNIIKPYSPNKRRFTRIDFFTTILVKQISMNKSPVPIPANAKNLSLTGILFESQTPFDIGTKIQLQIPLDEFNETLLILGTVVRIEVFGNNQYDIGVSFLEMDHNSKNEVSRYLLTQLSRNLPD
ncbi:MAG: diguanylate cyclase [Pseudomonadota bacterium]